MGHKAAPYLQLFLQGPNVLFVLLVEARLLCVQLFLQTLGMFPLLSQVNMYKNFILAM